MRTRASTDAVLSLWTCLLLPSTAGAAFVERADLPELPGGPAPSLSGASLLSAPSAVTVTLALNPALSLAAAAPLAAAAALPAPPALRPAAVPVPTRPLPALTAPLPPHGSAGPADAAARTRALPTRALATAPLGDLFDGSRPRSDASEPDYLTKAQFISAFDLRDAERVARFYELLQAGAPLHLAASRADLRPLGWDESAPTVPAPPIPESPASPPVGLFARLRGWFRRAPAPAAEDVAGRRRKAATIRARLSSAPDARGARRAADELAALAGAGSDERLDAEIVRALADGPLLDDRARLRLLEDVAKRSPHREVRLTAIALILGRSTGARRDDRDYLGRGLDAASRIARASGDLYVIHVALIDAHDAHERARRASPPMLVAHLDSMVRAFNRDLNRAADSLGSRDPSEADRSQAFTSPSIRWLP